MDQQLREQAAGLLRAAIALAAPGDSPARTQAEALVDRVLDFADSLTDEELVDVAEGRRRIVVGPAQVVA